MNGTWCRIGKNLFRRTARSVSKRVRNNAQILEFCWNKSTRSNYLRLGTIADTFFACKSSTEANRANSRSMPIRNRPRKNGRDKSTPLLLFIIFIIRGKLHQIPYTFEFLNSWLKNRPSQVSKFIISSCIIGFQHSINLPAPTERRPT